MMWDEDYHGRWGGMHDGSAGGWIVMGLFLVLLAALAVVVVIMLLRASGTPRHQPAVPLAPPAAAPQGEARRILETRFARGEIDEEEFRRRLAVLGGD